MQELHHKLREWGRLGRGKIGASCRSHSFEDANFPRVSPVPGSPQVSQGKTRLLIIRMGIIRSASIRMGIIRERIIRHATTSKETTRGAIMRHATMSKTTTSKETISPLIISLLTKKGEGGRPFLGRASLLS